MGIENKEQIEEFMQTIEEFMQTEDFNQLDELSKETLKSYLKKSKNRSMEFQNKGDSSNSSKKANRSYDKRDLVTSARKGARDRLKGVFHPKEAPYGTKNEDFDLDDSTLEQIEVSEDINALFSGEDISEDFKQKAQAIFEAAVLAKVEEQKTALEEEMQARLDEQSIQFAEGLVSKIDDYLEYVVSEWMEENKLAVEKGIKAEMVEDFMVGLKNLFMEHYIDIPEDKVEVVEELTGKYDELQSELDKAISENAEMKAQLIEFQKQSITSEVSEGLTEVQEAKLTALAENIEFISEEDYREKVLLVKSKYFGSIEERNDAVQRKDVDSESESLDEQFSPAMSQYVQSISRTLKK